jgi:hypothetical protein
MLSRVKINSKKMRLKFFTVHWFLIDPRQLRSMKYCVLLIGIFLFSCGGTLSEEQRKRMKEQMELHKIRRVTDVEITEAAFTKGRAILTTLQRTQLTDATIDSLQKASNGKFNWLTVSNPGKTETEKQLFEAYRGSELSSAQDNIQKLRRSDGTDSDSLLYTKPVFEKSNDTQELIGVLSIWLSRKQLILEMPKKK